MQNGTLTGSIVELNYRKHSDDVGHNSFQANSVELIYRFPHHKKTYGIVDYNELRTAIHNRYGEEHKADYKVSDEKALNHMIEQTSRFLFSKAEPAGLDAYITDMIEKRAGIDHAADAELSGYGSQPDDQEDEHDDEI